MRICFIADARSPIARQWIGYFPGRGHEVHVLSTTYVPESNLNGAKIHVLAPIVSRFEEDLKKGNSGGSARPAPSIRRDSAVRRLMSLWTPFKWAVMSPHARRLVRQIRPDLVHGLRVPIEAEIAAGCNGVPLIVSTWGNDFTLHAANSMFHRSMSRRVVASASALLADCYADIERARTFGLASTTPTRRVPGNGGIQTDIFRRDGRSDFMARYFGAAPDGPIVVNPRGFRPYVRNDVFLAAIPRILRSVPNVKFVCVGMKGLRSIEESIGQLGVERSVFLTDSLSAVDMADLFRSASVSVSPAVHDGTPNTLLEAMACGCFPVCGDLPSIREWVNSGHNGLLVDPTNDQELADAILLALSSPQLRRQAAQANAEIIGREADFGSCMREVERFYEAVALRLGPVRDANAQVS